MLNRTTGKPLLLSALLLLTACGQQSAEETDSAGAGMSEGEADALIAELEAAVSEAEQRVDRLHSVEQIQNLMSAYGYYVDQSMHDEVANLFTDEAELEILGRGRFYGIERIGEYMHNFGEPGPAYGGLFNHMQIQHIVSVSEDRESAQARARLFVMFGRLAENAPPNAQFGEGTYENSFERVDGQWRFSHLHGYQGHYTMYEDGWARHSSGIFAPYPNFPPDDPQSVDYDPYPAAFVPPFHWQEEDN